jgi:hypothetical protein
LFDYFRNDALDANDWFANANGLAKPQERQNDFGGTFSGPLVKERTFFFFSYEGLRLRLPQVLQTTVPDVKARQAASSALQPYFNAFPVPNGQDNPATGIAEFNASFSNKSSLDAYSLRLDHNLTHNISIFGRYNYSPSETVIRGNGGALSTQSPTKITTQTATLGVTWQFASHLASDLRVNYSRVNALMISEARSPSPTFLFRLDSLNRMVSCFLTFSIYAAPSSKPAGLCGTCRGKSTLWRAWLCRRERTA